MVFVYRRERWKNGYEKKKADKPTRKRLKRRRFDSESIAFVTYCVLPLLPLGDSDAVRLFKLSLSQLAYSFDFFLFFNILYYLGQRYPHVMSFGVFFFFFFNTSLPSGGFEEQEFLQYAKLARWKKLK